jgi:broad specificity phosphatase PhoE
MIMHYLTLLRHGESQGNSEGILQGQTDYPLTPAGVKQAEFLAAHWRSESTCFDLIISSPLKRAAQTAEIISSYLNIPIEYDRDWMERNYGYLEGSLLFEIDKRIPMVDFFQPYEPIGENGESQVDLYTRASLALQKVIRQHEGSYLVVSHGGILNKALYVVLGITPQGHYNSPVFHFSNAGYAQLQFNATSRQWAVINLNSHLSNFSDQGEKSWNQD